MGHGKIAKKCEICGAEFFVYPSSSKQRFCGNVCAGVFRSGPNHARWVGIKTSPCKNCGKEFQINKRNHDKTKKFCSYECCVEYRRVNGGPRAHSIGTRYVGSEGYLFVKIGIGLWREEHRIIAEKSIGRSLKRGEVVHHIDGNKTNNTPENLVVLTKSQHMDIHRHAEAIGLAVMAQPMYEFSIEGLGC